MNREDRRDPEVTLRANAFAEMLATGATWNEARIALNLTRGQASSCMRRIQSDLGLQAKLEKRRCGHPRTADNTKPNGRCRECSRIAANAHRRRKRALLTAAERYEDARRRYLPGQIDATRRKLAALEVEARRLGMPELVVARP